jgi:glycolate oxidase FAD binding subunit
VEPAAAALRPDGGGAELLYRLLGDAKAVERTASLLPGETAPLDSWAHVRTALATPPDVGTVRVRVSARPSDVLRVCRAVADVAGADALRGVYPLAGSVVAHVDDALLPGLCAAAERVDALLVAERAPGAGPAPCDVFGSPPGSLALMRAVKARFDPQRVLAPGRFVGGI